MATNKQSKMLYNVDWTLNLTKEFIQILMTATLCKDVRELKNHIILECVWKEIEKTMNINHEALKNFWYNQLHLQLFCNQPIHLCDIKIKLIEYLYDKGITHPKDVNWHNVFICFDGFTSHFLYKIYSNLIKYAKQKIRCSNIGDAIRYLHKNYIPYLIENPSDRMLPRIKYCDNKIEYFEEDIKEIEAYELFKKSLKLEKSES